MPRPIIEVDVDDSKFQRFVELFSSYQEKLAEQPDLWASIDKAMGNAGDALRDGASGGARQLSLAAAQAELIADHLREATKAQNDFSRATKSGWDAFGRSGARAAQGVGKAMAGAVSGSIAEMGSGIAGVATTAAAALGPIGLAAASIAAVVGGVGAGLKGLADVAVTRQRAAYSLGLTPGQQAGFEVYGQQFLGSGALQAAANAQLSYGNAGALATLGINFDDARKMSASDLAYKMLGGAVNAARANPKLPLENIPAVMQYLALGGQVGDVRNALKMGPGALVAAAADSARNAARLDLDPRAVANGALLKKAAEGAGISAQSWLINHTSGADPAMAKALDALSGGGGSLGDVVSGAGRAFQHVSDELDSRVNPALQSFAHSLNVASGGRLHRINQWQKGIFHSDSQNDGPLGDWLRHALGRPSSSADAAAADALGTIEGTWNSVNADSGALGKWQFMPGTADEHLGAAWIAKYGSTWTARGRANFLGSPKAQTAAFNDFYDQLYRDASKRTHDPQQILRMIALGWYGGEGSWNETQEQLNAPQTYGGHTYPSQNAYADKFIALIARAQRSSKPPVKVHVTNSTAARVAVSVNAAAQH